MRSEPAIVLDDLVALARDGVEAYELAADWGGELAALFRQLAAQRRHMAERLAEQVEALGQRPRDRDTVYGTAQRLMARIRGSFRGERPALLLAECQRADIAFAHGLATVDTAILPPGSDEMLRVFHAEIVAALGQLAAAKLRLRAG